MAASGSTAGAVAASIVLWRAVAELQAFKCILYGLWTLSSGERTGLRGYADGAVRLFTGDQRVFDLNAMQLALLYGGFGLPWPLTELGRWTRHRFARLPHFFRTTPAASSTITPPHGLGSHHPGPGDSLCQSQHGRCWRDTPCTALVALSASLEGQGDPQTSPQVPGQPQGTRPAREVECALSRCTLPHVASPSQK